MRTCIYCRKEKTDEDFSLEHVIPQCLGGSLAPDELKTRDVCEKCNNDLGLFVDASFEKNWLVSQQLQANARAQFNPSNPKAIPLVCMGPCELDVPDILQTEVCESWLGPFGEQVYWVRPHDEKLYWYGGGNPRTTKSVESRAYFMFSINSSKNAGLTWLTFKDAFSGRRVKKVMCTQVVGADPEEIGFSRPDLLDAERINFFMEKCLTAPSRHIKLAMYIRYDLRFIAKLAIGISHCLYGKASVSESYADELHKALWHKPDDELPLINGSTSFSSEVDPKFAEFAGMEGAVVLLITRSPNGTAINLNLGPRLNWTIKVAEHLNESLPLQEKAIIMYKEIGKCIQMPLNEFIAFKIGRETHPELDSIAAQMRASTDYFAKLTVT